MARIVLVAAVVLAGLLGHAGACPPGPCAKHMMRPPPPPPPPPVLRPAPIVYTRLIAGAPPLTGSTRIVRFLTAATWATSPPPGRRGQVLARIVTGPTEGRPAVRDLGLGRIARRSGMTFVELDGTVFELHSCGSRRHPLACLSQRDFSLDDLPIDPPPPPDGADTGGFAQPPP